MTNFKKKIIFFLVIFFSTSSVLFAEVLKDIQIKGNKRVSDESIKMFSNTKIGDNINSNKLNEILKNIYDTNFFGDVRVSFKDSVLVIFVEENPLVESVIIKGPKSKTLIGELKKKLKVKSRSSYNETLFLTDKKI